MSMNFKQRIAAKKLLMDELKVWGASNEILFRMIAKVDKSTDPEGLISDLSKAIALLVDVKAAVKVTRKLREALVEGRQSSV